MTGHEQFYLPSTAEERMGRMMMRLARLEGDRQAAADLGWGEGITSQYDSDIYWQKSAIRDLTTVYPNLAIKQTVTSKGGAQ